MIDLAVSHVSKKFTQQGSPAVNDLSFSLRRGEILALVGPSGCGKTTTLRLVAGLEVPDCGTIYLNDRLVAGEGQFIPVEQRGVGFVFQEHALFPHLDVYGNVAFGLHRVDKKRRQAIVADTLKLVGLDGLARRYPHELSGGERQRVALARAFAPRPVLLLMDEPFSSLDADLRMQVRSQVRQILKSHQATVIFVTHDQEEALFMGDRLAVFQEGSLVQIGEPEEVFHASKTRFVAEFMGDSDFIQGKTTATGVHTVLGILPQAVGLPPDTGIEVAFRADDIDFSPHSQGNAVIARRLFRGAFYLYSLQLDSGQTVSALKPHTDLLPVGERVAVFFNAGHPLPVFREGTAIQPTIQ